MSRPLRPARPSARAATMAADRLDQIAAASNAMAAADVMVELTIEQRLAKLEARPRAAGGKRELTGLKGLTTTVVTLTTPMPDDDYVATATLKAPGGVLLGAGGVTAITAQTASTVTVQLSLGTALAPASCTVQVTAVKG